jgi:hypothetical protein
VGQFELATPRVLLDKGGAQTPKEASRSQPTRWRHCGRMGVTGPRLEVLDLDDERRLQ